MALILSLFTPLFSAVFQPWLYFPSAQIPQQCSDTALNSYKIPPHCSRHCSPAAICSVPLHKTSPTTLTLASYLTSFIHAMLLHCLISTLAPEITRLRWGERWVWSPFVTRGQAVGWKVGSNGPFHMVKKEELWSLIPLTWLLWRGIGRAAKVGKEPLYTFQPLLPAELLQRSPSPIHRSSPSSLIFF